MKLNRNLGRQLEFTLNSVHVVWNFPFHPTFFGGSIENPRFFPLISLPPKWSACYFQLVMFLYWGKGGVLIRGLHYLISTALLIFCASTFGMVSYCHFLLKHPKKQPKHHCGFPPRLGDLFHYSKHLFQAPQGPSGSTGFSKNSPRQRCPRLCCHCW